MSVTTIEVISVPVTDQDRAKRFYAEALGFTPEIDSEFNDGAMRWVMLCVWLSYLYFSKRVHHVFRTKDWDKFRPGRASN